MRLRAALLLYAAPWFFVPLVRAQIGAATLTGHVTDPSGAVVPGVSVTVVQTGTNFEFTALTNAEGIYRVQSLQPGAYRVTFEIAGFKRVVREGVELRLGDTVPVDVVLQVGAASDSIEITAQTQMLETETSATGAVQTGEFLYKMPLYQRYVNSTLHLVPGMQAGGYAYGGDLGSYHVAGQRSGAIGLFEDGVVGNDPGAGTSTVKPLQNSVAEVKVLTTTLPAEYGHSAGGVVAVVKKTGTNELHGMASAYGRTRSMQHRLFFDRDRTTKPTPTAPDGLPGFFMLPDGNLGGPVVIPKLYDGRNKTFFFVGYQRLIEKKIAQAFGVVPTPEMKAGDFSFGGLGNPLYDPATTRQLADGTWTREPFPNSRIPESRFDPVARKILQMDPWRAPNYAGTFNSGGPVGNLLYDEFARTFFDDWNARVDHQFTPGLRLFWSLTGNWQSGYGRPTNIRITDLDATNGNYQPNDVVNHSLGMTWVASPTLVNDMRVGYFRRRQDRFVPSYQKNYGAILGIPNISPELLPSFAAGGTGTEFTPDGIYGLTVTGPSRTIGETLSLRDDVTRMRGKHAFKLGYEVLNHRFNATVTNRPSGDFRFDGMTEGLQPDGNTAPRTGNTFAGFLLGYVRQATFDQELASWLPRSWIHSFYFQDDWKVSSTFTLNLGIRYMTESPFSTKNGLMSNFDPAAVDALTGRRGAIAHASAGLNARDTNNFQPRVGLAWYTFQKWVFRGGFAINTVDVKFPQTRGQFEEYVASANQQRAPGDPRPLYRISQGPDPVTFNTLSNGTAPFVGTNYSTRLSEWWDPALHNPYVMNWHGSLQYELRPSYALEFSYQGSAGVGLIERWQVNTFPIDFAANDPVLRADVFRASQNYRPYTQFGDVRLRSNFGHSTFHSGTVKLEKRYSRGLTFSAFYTYSKALDSQDADNNGGGRFMIFNMAAEKGRAGFDRNHRWVAAALYDLPLGKGKRFFNRGGAVNHLLGGFELAWIQTFETGNPLTFSFSNSPYNYYSTFAGDRRPDIVNWPRLRDNWYDLGADRFNQQNSNAVVGIDNFAYPAAFTPGTAGRNIMTGTPLRWTQLSVEKNVYVAERWRVQLRWDFQNAFKTYNFNTPTTAVDLQNPRTFGKVTSDPRTASFGGQPLMNLTLQVSF